MFIANTAKPGPEARNLPGMINSCSEQMNTNLYRWSGCCTRGVVGPEQGDLESGTGCQQVTGGTDTAHGGGPSKCPISQLGLGERLLLKIISTCIASGGEKGPSFSTAPVHFR